MTVMIDDFIGPNGLALSPDESVLYVVESRSTPRTIWAFDVIQGGRKLGDRRLVICGAGHAGWLSRRYLRQSVVGWGMGDAELDGVHVFTSEDEAIGHIDLPERCANVCFGGSIATGCSWRRAMGCMRFM